MKVKCPHCGTEREIKGTEERVRCPSKGGCGERYYVYPNIVLQEDKKGDIKGQIITPTITTIREDVSLGTDLDRTVLIAGLMDTIKIYKNKVLSREGKILAKSNSHEGKKVLEWVEMYDDQKAVPMLVVHQAYFQKVDLAYKELKKLRV